MTTDTEAGFEGLVGFKDELERIRAAITEFESGQKTAIAIIGEPFAGRTTLIHAIEEMTDHKVTKLLLSSLVKTEDAVRLPEESKSIVIVDHCQFLFSRTIGGFDLLERFLKRILASDNLFITTWNLYAWDYLDEVINVSHYFPIQLRLPKFTTEETRELILSHYEENELEFVDDTKSENQPFASFTRVPVTLKPLGKSLSIPSVTFNFNLLKFRLARKKETKTAEDTVFEMINYHSNGNPGVAKVIWEKSLQYPTIKPSYIKECSFKIELDYNEAFILYCILTIESVTKEELVALSGDGTVDRVLSRLVQQDLITVDNAHYTLNPEALNCITSYLKKEGVIW